MRLFVAVWVARLSGMASRLTGRGGSSLPGLVARRLDPSVLSQLSSRLPKGSLLLTGTNGKTTTSALVRHMLEGAGWRLVTNRSGANLILGLTASFLQAERLKIWPRAEFALLETDEATMPRASQELEPRGIMVSNFFRDQLDRYGELSTTVGYVARAIENVKPNGFLVLNADDPQVAHLGRVEVETIYYGLQLEVLGSQPGYDASDARFCPECGQALEYRVRYYAHLGHYRCPHCHWARPDPRVVVHRWDRSQGVVEMSDGAERLVVPWQAPGLYNLYNLVAAVASARALGVTRDVIVAALKAFQPAFGRMERVSVGETTVWLALVKNPVGFNQVLQAMEGEVARHLFALLVINDRYADGRDVSWLWDVDFEHWIARLPIRTWWVSGTRAHDMAVRLKYAGVRPEDIRVEPVPSQALEALTKSHGMETVYVLPTYTALMEIRQYLTQRGYVRHFREG